MRLSFALGKGVIMTLVYSGTARIQCDVFFALSPQLPTIRLCLTSEVSIILPLQDRLFFPFLGIILRVKLGGCSIGKQVHGPDVAGHVANVRVA